MNPFSILEEQRPTNTFTLTYDSKTLIAHNISNEKKRKEERTEADRSRLEWNKKKEAYQGPR